MFKSKELALKLMLLLIVTCASIQGLVEAFGPAVYLADLPEQFINRARTSSGSNYATEDNQDAADQQIPFAGTRKYVFRDSEGRTVMPSQMNLDRLNQILETVRLHLRQPFDLQLSEQPEFDKRMMNDGSSSPNAMIIKHSTHRKLIEPKRLAAPKPNAWFMWRNEKDRARQALSLNGSEEIPISSPMHSINNRRWNREPSGGGNTRWNNLRGMWGKRAASSLLADSSGKLDDMSTIDVPANGGDANLPSSSDDVRQQQQQQQQQQQDK